MPEVRYDYMDAGYLRRPLPLLRPHLEPPSSEPSLAVTARLLPIPDDPRFPAMVASWPQEWSPFQFPRSRWLHIFEAMLREFYPQANSRSLSLTARHAAPFYLRDGPNVP